MDQRSPHFLTSPALATPAGFQLRVSPVVTAGPWRDQTKPGVMEPPQRPKVGSGRAEQGPAGSAPGHWGGTAPFSNHPCTLCIRLRLWEFMGRGSVGCHKRGAPRKDGIKPCTPAQAWPLCTQDTAPGRVDTEPGGAAPTSPHTPRCWAFPLPGPHLLLPRFPSSRGGTEGAEPSSAVLGPGAHWAPAQSKQSTPNPSIPKPSLFLHLSSHLLLSQPPW